MRIGSLCTGYGGLDMAVESAFGATTAWVSDIDPGARKILAHRFPDVPNLGDMTQIDWSTVEPVDIITGGTPCQDLSHAGKRAGMTEGTRSNLWVQMREAIATIRPTWVIWENVRGAYSAAADSELESCPGCMGGAEYRGPALRALGRVLGDLSELGFDAEWRGIRAADVGAPHGRFRVFVVARSADARGEALKLGTGLRTGQPRGVGRGRLDHGAVPLDDRSTPLLGTPRSAEWKGTGPVGSKSHAHRLERGYLDAQVLLLPTARATDGTKGGPNQRGSSGDLMLPSAVARLVPTPTGMDAASSGAPKGNTYRGTSLTDATVRQPEDWGQYAPAIARWESVLGRPAPEPTELGPKGKPRLSARFDEWLMGIPAGWLTDIPGLSWHDVIRACGNGVVPQQAYAAIGDALTTFEETAA